MGKKGLGSLTNAFEALPGQTTLLDALLTERRKLWTLDQE